MKSARSGFTGLALMAMLFLSGCQNTITSIQLPDLSQVTWRAFATGFTYENNNLTVETTGSHIVDAYLSGLDSRRYCGDPGTGEHAMVAELDSCPGGFTDYGVHYNFGLFVEVGSQFTGGSIVLMDGLTVVRSIPVTVGSGRQITINYGVSEGIIPYAFALNELIGNPEPYFSDNFTVFAMFPPDPGFRSNINPETESEEALLGLLSSGLCLSSFDLAEGADIIVFDVSRGSGSVTCNVALTGIPTLSTWMLGAVALMLAGFGVIGARRQRPRRVHCKP